MASTDTATRTAAGTDPQEPAKRHLWMHFTRMGSYDNDNEVPIIVRGEGPYVYDEHGKRYLDGLSALFCVNAGHGRTELGDAMAAPGRASSTSSRSGATPTRGRSSSPTRIASLAPGDLNRVFFTNSGSEAVESAIKLARAYHQRTGQPAQKIKFIAREVAYHGTTLGALQATGITGAAQRLRAARPRRDPRAEHEQLPLAGGPRPALGRGPDRGEDRVRGAGDGRRGDPRAAAERRRLHPAAGGLLPARARDLRPPRRPADLRRGDLRLGPARPLLRLRALRLPARHHHRRQGAHLGLRADGRR